MQKPIPSDAALPESRADRTAPHPIKEQGRDPALDFIRIFAFFSVVSVHFFLNAGFYEAPMLGLRLYCANAARAFFMICVPLFLLLTGYLNGGKKPEKRYYAKLVPLLLTYLLISIVCVLFKKFALRQEISFSGALLGIFAYTDANYAWYVEMYLGLFLLTPFLNAAYFSLPDKKSKRLLVITMLLLTALPIVANEKIKLLPAFFLSLYPVTYYFIGVYLREYGFPLRPGFCAAGALLTALALGSYCFFTARGGVFQYSAVQDYGSLAVTLVAVLTFAFLLRLPFRKLPAPILKFASGAADCTFGAYLISYVFDQCFYPLLNEHVASFADRIYAFVPMVLAVGICSLAAARLIKAAVNGILQLI